MKGKKTIDQRLAEIDDLRAELLDKRASMTEREKVEALEAAQPKVERGTPERDALLASGYEMSAADAERLILERDADPHTWPFEQYQ